MTEFFDQLETRSADARAEAQAQLLPRVVAGALEAPGWRAHLGDIDPASIRDRAALAKLKVLRKSDLPGLQKADWPFGGFARQAPGEFARLFTSPGPIFEGESEGANPWRAARVLHAAGFRKGDIVLNTFSYHLTPGGFILDSGARALGCAVIPAGPGNTQAQLELIAAYRPGAYTGTPDFLKIILDAAQKEGVDASSMRKAVVSGAAFPPSLQSEIAARGIDAFQAYATADLGAIAYETSARDGMVVNEDVILEVVRPGTGDPVAEGEVGEVVVTVLDEHHPLLRLALGDLTAILSGPSPCGRTHTRIKGWMGRADQTAKVKGMFVRPEQIAEIGRRHREIGRLRLVVTRAEDQDAMTLFAETSTPEDAGLAEALGVSLAAVTRVKGQVALVAPGSLANDGKVIEDKR
ncbi:phenylacetate-CoA ligase [Rhizobiales bacterium GAS188]|nr:phenylacetate-CoA ligase [Rhizobiales bacterium GAS188]